MSRLSPISVAPPWASALAEVERARDAKGLRVAYVADIAGIGVEAEIATICRTAAQRLRDAGAAVEEIAFDVSDGRDPYQAWRGLWMVGQQYANLSELERFGQNLRGNVQGRPEGDGRSTSPPPSRSGCRCFIVFACCSSASTSCSRPRRR